MARLEKEEGDLGGEKWIREGDYMCSLILIDAGLYILGGQVEGFWG